MTITVGADPEFFLLHATRSENGEGIIPCVGLVPGTKQAPHDLGEGYFCHEDNVAVELGIPHTPDGSVLGHIIKDGKARILSEFFPGGEHILHILDHKDFTEHDLRSKQAQTFGCEPDFDAYTNGKMRDVPDVMKRGMTRYAGGHVHIGGNFNCPPFVAALFADLFLSVYMQSFAPRQTPNRYNVARPRAEYYGRPGVFRPKEYGIEYRTPSNWWCGSVKNGNQIGYMASRLGIYLEQTTATTLRETIRKIDWIKVKQTMLPQAGVTRTAVRENADQMLEDVRAAGVLI